MSQTANRRNTTKAETEKQFSKAAFLSAATSTKDRLVIEVVLSDDKTYTKAEADKLIKEWASKKINKEVK